MQLVNLPSKDSIYLNEDPKDLIQEYVVSGYSTDSIGQAMFNKQYITTSKNHGFI